MVPFYILLLPLSLVVAAPANITSTFTNCVFPDIAINTIDYSFTLRANTFNDNNIPWPVQLSTPAASKATQPYISRTRIAQPVFRLTNGKLTTGGPTHTRFRAFFGPTIKVFPPELQLLLFGGNGVAFNGFFAGYACDGEGIEYLELKAGRGEFFLYSQEAIGVFPILPRRFESLNGLESNYLSNCNDGWSWTALLTLVRFLELVVPAATEGAKIYGKPGGFVGAQDSTPLLFLPWLPDKCHSQANSGYLFLRRICYRYLEDW